MSDTEWNKLENIDFSSMGSIWNYCSEAQRLAGETGLVVSAAFDDMYTDLTFAASEQPTSWQAKRKARKATRRKKAILEAMHKIQVEFGKIPADVKSAYEAEIIAAKGKHRKKTDWSK